MSGVILVLRALEGCRLTTEQIIADTGLKPKTVSTYIARLRHGTPKRIRVAKWNIGGRAVYELGDEPDAPPRKPLSKNELWMRWFKRMRKDPNKHMNRLMQHRAYRARKSSKPLPQDPLMYALYGGRK